MLKDFRYISCESFAQFDSLLPLTCYVDHVSIFRHTAELLQQLFQAPADVDDCAAAGGTSTDADGNATGDDESDSEDDADVENDAQQRAVIEHALATARSPGHLSKGISPTAAGGVASMFAPTDVSGVRYNIPRSALCAPRYLQSIGAPPCGRAPCGRAPSVAADACRVSRVACRAPHRRRLPGAHLLFFLFSSHRTR